MKTIKLTETHRDMGGRGIALLPYGYMYETRYKEAGKGDVLKFFSGETAEINAVTLVNMSKKATDLICRLVYGVGIATKRSEWVRDAVFLGHGRDVVSTELCYMATYELKGDEPKE